MSQHGYRYARRVLNQEDRPLNPQPSVHAFGAPDKLTELEAALKGNQVCGEKPHITRERLKKWINANKWGHIGLLFGFTPRYTLLAGNNVFDWTSCNEQFWKVYKVPVVPPKVLNLVSSRSEQAFKDKVVKSKGHPHRHTLWERQGGKCYYCFQPVDYKKFTQDHVVALSKGGSNGIRNKVGACRPCNNAKGSMTQAEFLASAYLDKKLKSLASMSTVVQSGTVAA